MNAFLHNSHINYKSAALVSGSGVLAQPLGIHKTNSPVIQPSVEYTYDATNCYAIIFMLRITISRKGICCRLGVVNIYLGLTSIDNQPTKKSSSLRPHIGIARRNNRGKKKKNTWLCTESNRDCIGAVVVSMSSTTIRATITPHNLNTAWSS